MSIKGVARQIVEFYERLSNWEHEVVRGSDLTPGQMHAIEIIGHETSLRMKELAEKLGVTTGTLTVTVDRLENKGLIERKPHETDRRSFRVALTEAGQDVAALSQEICETPAANAFLARFASLAKKGTC